MQDVEKIQAYVSHLISNKTNSEKYIEKLLKELRLNFTPQYPIVVQEWFYILDIYLPELNIYIEIDGKHHSASNFVKYDLRRKELIREQWNIKEIRINNSDVFKLNAEKLYYILTKKRKNKRKKNKKKIIKFELTRKEKAIQQRYDNLKL